MKLAAVHTFPVWADTTAQEAFALCLAGGRALHPAVTGWANALAIDIAGQRRYLLATA